jgi:hypothetical protein
MTFTDLTNPASNYANYDEEVAYKFRYTFGGQSNDTIHDPSRCVTKTHKALTGALADIIKTFASRMTCGIERFNSHGEPTYIHTHIHFTSKVLKNTIRKKIDRFLDKEGQPFSGIKTICLKPEAFFTEQKFFQYPYKQYVRDFTDELHLQKLSKGFSKERINEFRSASHSSWLTCIEINSNKDKKDNLDTLFLRATQKVKELPCPKTLRSIQKTLITLYKEEDRPINLTTIQGYSYTLGLKFKVIDEDYLLNKLEN